MYMYMYIFLIYFICIAQSLHYKNDWVILTLFWLHQFQFLLRLYKSKLLSCLAR